MQFTGVTSFFDLSMDSHAVRQRATIGSLALLSLYLLLQPTPVQAISITADLTGPATLFEGQTAEFAYSWTITNDTAANHTHFGALQWDTGVGSAVESVTGFSGSTIYSQTYSDNGTYTVTASPDQPIDLYRIFCPPTPGCFDYYQASVDLPTQSLTLSILNLDPVIESLTPDLLVSVGESFDFSATATDPGIFDVLTYSWDFDGDGHYDATGAGGSHAYAASGFHIVGLRVTDGDGGEAFQSFQVEVQSSPPTHQTIPEPATLALLGLGLAGLGYRRKKSV